MSISTDDAFLLYSSALIGLSFGVFGNLFVTSLFRNYDNIFDDDGEWHIKINKEIVIKRHKIDSIIFYVSIIALGILTYNAIQYLLKYSSVPA